MIFLLLLFPKERDVAEVRGDANIHGKVRQRVDATKIA